MPYKDPTKQRNATNRSKLKRYRDGWCPTCPARREPGKSRCAECAAKRRVTS